MRNIHKKVFPMLVLFLLVFISCSQSTRYVKTGVNYSQIFVNNSRGNIGLSFGVGKEPKIKGNLFWAQELYFYTIGGSLLKKKILYYPGYTIYPVDMHYSLGYLQIPILLKYKIINRKNKETRLFFGPHVSFGLFDASRRFSPTNHIYENVENNPNLNYDYSECYDCGPRELNVLFNSLFGLNFGIEQRMSNYVMEFRYVNVRLNSILGGGHTLNESCHTFLLQVGVMY